MPKIVFLHYIWCALILLCLVGQAVSAELIWLAPADTSTTFRESPLLNKGEWGELTNGMGSRSDLNVHFDSKGTLWIFFGFVSDRSVNKVWNYDIANDLWRWTTISNDTTQYLNWGTRGVAGPEVYPGFVFKGQSAIDSQDNVWFFGGFDENVCADATIGNALFRFNTTSQQFTWIDGGSFSDRPDNGDFGTLGEASASVWPAYTFSGCMLSDSSNNLWLIGGQSRLTNTKHNAVFHYNTSSGWWTWVNGDPTQSTLNDLPNNVFGSRDQLACTIDTEDRIWVFGGESTGSFSNDLWSFDTKTREWTAEYEDAEYASPGSIVTNNTFDVNNFPPAMYGCAMVDRRDGTLMIVSGGDVSQIWFWHKIDKLWKIIYGDNSVRPEAVYGTRGQPGSTLGFRLGSGHEPGLNSAGQLVLIGGYTSSIYRPNDVWIIPQNVCEISPNPWCSPDASCTYIKYTPACTCNEGFEGDGRTCTAIVIPEAQSPISDPTPSVSPTSTSSPSSPSNTPSKTPGKVSESSRSVVVLGISFTALILSL